MPDHRTVSLMKVLSFHSFIRCEQLESNKVLFIEIIVTHNFVEKASLSFNLNLGSIRLFQ